MAKPIKSSVRSMLFTMIKNYNWIKSNVDQLLAKKQQIFDKIISTADGLYDEDKKCTIKNLIQDLRSIENDESINFEKGYMTRISDMTEVSVRTLQRIKKEGSINQGEWNTAGKKRLRPPTVSNLDDFDILAIRNKITEFYCVKKQVPTLRSLLVEFRKSIGFTGCRETLRQLLHRNGFNFKKNKNERSLLIEKFEISAWRHKYLRKIHEKRLQGIPIVYIDETYIHQNYKLLKQHGHEVIKLPPYHCDLNAIEHIWSLAKRKVASKNLGVESSKMEQLIRECFDRVTSDDGKKCTDRVIQVENDYKEGDRITETELEPFIIQVRDDDSDSDDSYSGIEFLESDFDYEME